MELKVPKIKTAVSVGSSSLSIRRTNLFLELHKLDYEKRRLMNRLNYMTNEKAFMEERVMTIQKDMTSLLTKSGIKQPVQKGKSSNKLKY